jgi:hypothetical protein
MNKKNYPYIELDLNVILSELVIINLYILLKYFSDIRFAGDFIIRSPWDVEAKLTQVVTLACLDHYCMFVISFYCM